MVGPRSVLIVDRSEETREVLATALARHGVKVLSASLPLRGLQMARQHRPDLIVLDLESDGHDGELICEPYARQSRASQTTLVMLGNLRRGRRLPPVGEFVPKPYHYGPLIRKIEELLLGTGRDYARCA